MVDLLISATFDQFLVASDCPVCLRPRKMGPMWGFFCPLKQSPQMALTDAAIRNANPKDKPYKVADSQGLYLCWT